MLDMVKQHGGRVPDLFGDWTDGMGRVALGRGKLFPKNAPVSDASVMIDAEAKRLRKAAKRHRDAELTRLGHEASKEWVLLTMWWERRSTEHDRLAPGLLRRADLLNKMRIIRCNE